MDDDDLLLVSQSAPSDNNEEVNDDDDILIEDALGNENNQNVANKSNKPFFYCRFVAKYPVTSFLLTLFGHLILAAVSGILILTGYNLYPTFFKGLPMDLYNIPYKMREDSWDGRFSYPNRSGIYLSDYSNRYWPRKYDSDYIDIELFYDIDGGNIFTESCLKKIKEIENKIISVVNFKYYCATVNSSAVCRKPRSILRFFDGTYGGVNPIFIDKEFKNINLVLYEAYNNNKTKHDFVYFLPETFTLSKTSASASLTRSMIPVSWSYYNGTDAQDYMENTMKHKLQSIADSVTEFKMYYLSETILFDDLQKQTIKDGYLAGGSVCFIFLFIIFHTRSLWISCWAVLSIATSYLETNIIYRCILGYHYFGYFHIMVIFIILGIGADDLFVFYDTWRLTSHRKYESLAHRLQDAYSKSMLSMLITSLTTAVAFFSSCSSPVLATRSFGVFSGILVILNYISVIVFFPTVIIVYHVKIKQSNCCKRKCFKSKTLSERNTIEITENTPENDGCSEQQQNMYDPIQNIGDQNDVIPNGIDRALADDNLEQREEMEMPNKKMKKLVTFVRDYYFGFITDKVIRWILLLFFFLVVVFFSYQASRLQVDNKQIKYFVQSHNYAKARERKEDRFIEKSEDVYTTVYITWGLKLRDRDSCNFTSIKCKGKEVFDDEFDPNPPQNQLALKRFCDTLHSLSERQVSELRIKKNVETQELEIACFTRDMDRFLKTKNVKYNNRTLDLSLPWDSEKTETFLKAMSHDGIYGKKLKFPYYFYVPLYYWLTNGYTGMYSTDFDTYENLIGLQMTNYTRQYYDLLRRYGFNYGNKIKFISVLINTTIDQSSTSFTEGISVVEKWETFIQNEMNKLPPGLKGGFQFGYFEWHWLYVQQSLARNAIIGITLGVSLAFPIITIATMNIVLGILATLTICCTTICVIGVIPLVGWKLGLLVSLNMCLVVGLSVDYVVHLAEGYHLSPHKDRISRTRDMLEAMGSPVIYGALTTIGAAVFMFFAKIQFFLQFATFIFANIGFSFLFSFGFFTTMVGILGPENDTGSLKKLFCCFRRCKFWSRKNTNYARIERSGVI